MSLGGLVANVDSRLTVETSGLHSHLFGQKDTDVYLDLEAHLKG